MNKALFGLYNQKAKGRWRDMTSKTGISCSQKQRQQENLDAFVFDSVKRYC